MTKKRIMAYAQVAENSYFYTTLPKKPRCADNYEHGILIRTKTHAIRFQHIQVNPPWLCNHIVIDIDYPVSNPDTLQFVWEERNLPVPTHAVINPDTMKAHLILTLDEPVYKNNKKQMEFYNDVVSILTKLYNGDPEFKNIVTKNPLHPRWKTISTNKTYTLTELKLYAPQRKGEVIELKNYKRHKINEDYAIRGRNSRLFEETRIKAYCMVKDYHDLDSFQVAVMSTALDLNDGGLCRNEVKDTVKSIAKWTWSRRHNIKPYIQAIRGTYTPDEVKERQKKAAQDTNQTRLAKTIQAIINAVKELARTIPPDQITKKQIAAEAARSIRCIQGHSATIEDAIRSCSQDLSPCSVPSADATATTDAPQVILSSSSRKASVPLTRPALSPLSKPFAQLTRTFRALLQTFSIAHRGRDKL